MIEFFADDLKIAPAHRAAKVANSPFLNL
jgi:hypothetical protein